MDDWQKLFDNFGVKTVSQTDKSRGAYVLNDDQHRAVLAAGRQPATVRPAPGFQVEVLFERAPRMVEASFYLSIRSRKAKRPPEPRMGHEIISQWMQPGDEIVIGNIGTRLCAAKLKAASRAAFEDVERVAGALSLAELLARAIRARGQPPRARRSRNDFVRDPYVVAAALARAAGCCDTPGCSSELFETDAGHNFLEVHHIVPLREGGDDALSNACALCPRCHRQLHFDKHRAALQARLQTATLARYDPISGNRR